MKKEDPVYTFYGLRDVTVKPADSGFTLTLAEEDIKDILKTLKVEKFNLITDKQMKALHLWFGLVAEALNEAGFDMRKFIKEGVDIPWTKTMVKEHLWRPVQEIHLKKKSVKKLEKQQIDEIYEILNRVIGERTGIHIPFPSQEELDKLNLI